MTKNNQRGFTIIELLIATVIFTIVLLMITGTIVQIGRLYYKGLTRSRTQELSRTISDNISRAIQYTPGVIKDVTNNGGTPSKGVCIGLKRYSFQLNTKVTKDTDKPRSLTTDNVGNICSESDVSVSSTRNELLGDRMRINTLDVKRVGAAGSTAYTVTTRIIYGDDDLLCFESGNGETGAACDNNILLTTGDLTSGVKLRCKDIQSGSEFCAVSELSTIVERRIQ